eukprot:7261665-Lingulodinium_polyedra.AAC.1
MRRSNCVEPVCLAMWRQPFSLRRASQCGTTRRKRAATCFKRAARKLVAKRRARAANRVAARRVSAV